MELDAERAVAKQEEERHLMQQVGAQAEVVNQRQGRGDQRLVEYPRQRQRRTRLCDDASTGTQGDGRRVEESVDRHKQTNQP